MRAACGKRAGVTNHSEGRPVFSDLAKERNRLL